MFRAASRCGGEVCGQQGWPGTRNCHVGVSGVFFFQAEDGIRDVAVTGVQTCALPILISTQHGADWRSANGDAPIDDRAPSAATMNADTVPLPAPPWAFETNSWLESVGRNSLPNGPGPWAANGDPDAAVRRPLPPTLKLSISELPTRVPMRFLPVESNSTSPGWASSGSATVEPPSGLRRPPPLSVKPDDAQPGDVLF